RQSNTGITDVLQGVTLNLKGAGSTSLQVTSDTSGIADSVKGLVKAFQDAIQDVKSQTAYDSQTRTFGLLANSSALQGLSGGLSALLGTKVNTGGTITSLFDLGLQFNRDGSITMNEDTLTKALADHADDVKTLFAGKTGVTGLGTLLTDKLSNLTQPSSGTIATEKQATQEQINPKRLILMLYEGALEDLRLAKEGIEQQNTRKRGEHLSRAVAIISTLLTSVDSNVTDEPIAFLRRLYQAMLIELGKVAVTHDV